MLLYPLVISPSLPMMDCELMPPHMFRDESKFQHFATVAEGLMSPGAGIDTV